MLGKLVADSCHLHYSWFIFVDAAQPGAAPNGATSMDGQKNMMGMFPNMELRRLKATHARNEKAVTVARAAINFNSFSCF